MPIPPPSIQLRRRSAATPFFGASAIVLLLSSGCDFRQPQWRSYEEVTLREQSTHNHGMPPDRLPKPAAKAKLTWTAPEGWVEQPGSGMRLATLTVTSPDGGSATCTLVSLSGSAGGLEANVRRWIGQLGLAVPGDVEFSAFLSNQLAVQSAGGFSGTVVDLSSIGTAADGTTMLAALMDVDGATLFVKMTGPAALLETQKESFIALCNSLRQDT